LDRTPVAGVAAVAADRIMLVVTEMISHLRLQSGLQPPAWSADSTTRSGQPARCPFSRAWATRCSAIPRSELLRHPPPAEPAPHLRAWDPLLPGCATLSVTPQIV
jgi:hypothetical protein